MSDINISIISNDRCYISGIESALESCEAPLQRRVVVNTFPFEKTSFKNNLLKIISEKSAQCDLLIFDCNCSFMDFQEACQTFYGYSKNKALKANLLFLYEVGVCLPQADMYGHFTLLKKNITVEDFRFFFINKFSELGTGADAGESEVERLEKITSVCEKHLTATETIILKELIRGRKPMEIARILNRSIKTISSHKNRALRKLSSKSLSSLILV